MGYSSENIQKKTVLQVCGREIMKGFKGDGDWNFGNWLVAPWVRFGNSLGIWRSYFSLWSDCVYVYAWMRERNLAQLRDCSFDPLDHSYRWKDSFLQCDFLSSFSHCNNYRQRPQYGTSYWSYFVQQQEEGDKNIMLHHPKSSCLWKLSWTFCASNVLHCSWISYAYGSNNMKNRCYKCIFLSCVNVQGTCQSKMYWCIICVNISANSIPTFFFLPPMISILIINLALAFPFILSNFPQNSRYNQLDMSGEIWTEYKFCKTDQKWCLTTQQASIIWRSSLFIGKLIL